MTGTLIVNADDFGMSPGINRGILVLHDRGVVTSTSFMPLAPFAEAAAAGASSRPDLAVGLHLDLGSWALSDGRWTPAEGSTPVSDPQQAWDEIERQLERFRSLTGRDPTHLDSHQHVHRDPSLSPVAEEAARRLGVPLRGYCSWIDSCGGFFGMDRHGESKPGWVSVTNLIRIVEGLGGGVTELTCHPAAAPDAPDQYRRERVLELDALSDPSFLRQVRERGLRLRSFADVDVALRE